MTTIHRSKKPIEPRIAPFPASPCPAVIRCCEEWTREHHAALAVGIAQNRAIVRGNQAYKNAMPALNNLDNIRDFISCVTYGMLIHAIIDPIGGKLLYAAQVASATCKSTSQPICKPGEQVQEPGQKATLPPTPSPLM